MKMSATSETEGEYNTVYGTLPRDNQLLESDQQLGCCTFTCDSNFCKGVSWQRLITHCLYTYCHVFGQCFVTEFTPPTGSSTRDNSSTNPVTAQPTAPISRNDDYESEQGNDARSDTHKGNNDYLVVGRVLWNTNGMLQYTIQNSTLLPLVPVIAFYSPTDCLHLQAQCMRSIYSEEISKIDQSNQLGETVTFTMLRHRFAQRPTDVITISASGWPKLDGGNVLFAPETSTYDLAMTFQKSLLMSLCHCLIITVGVIGRVQLHSLVQILTEARQRNKTVFVLHCVATQREFEVRYTEESILR